MKLFQIEEPEGGPADPDAPGAAVGIDIAQHGMGQVAIAVGGNAEILPDENGARTLNVVLGRASEAKKLAALVLGLRGRAEKQIARPVTHAVIASDLDAVSVAQAAEAAGLAILRLVDRRAAAAIAGSAASQEAPVLGAAILAEDLAAHA
jgi:hypothetical protein